MIPVNRVELYELTQYVTVESKDMKVVPEVSRNITSLIKDDVEIDSGSPRYLYTKLSELKIDMLAERDKGRHNAGDTGGDQRQRETRPPRRSQNGRDADQPEGVVGYECGGEQ